MTNRAAPPRPLPSETRFAYIWLREHDTDVYANGVRSRLRDTGFGPGFAL